MEHVLDIEYYMKGRHRIRVQSLRPSCSDKSMSEPGIVRVNSSIFTRHRQKQVGGELRKAGHVM
jgi:hypothetical protein